MSYTVELSNGHVFTGLEQSGTCYVSGVEVKESDFAGGLKLVKGKGRPSVEGEGQSAAEESYELEYPKLGGVKKLGNEWYFWLKETSAEERALSKAQADVEYVAMMLGVEL